MKFHSKKIFLPLIFCILPFTVNASGLDDEINRIKNNINKHNIEIERYSNALLIENADLAAKINANAFTIISEKLSKENKQPLELRFVSTGQSQNLIEERISGPLWINVGLAKPDGISATASFSKFKFAPQSDKILLGFFADLKAFASLDVHFDTGVGGGFGCSVILFSNPWLPSTTAFEIKFEVLKVTNNDIAFVGNINRPNQMPLAFIGSTDCSPVPLLPISLPIDIPTDSFILAQLPNAISKSIEISIGEIKIVREFRISKLSANISTEGLQIKANSDLDNK